MEKTYILCLANSRKYGERCVAGIELAPGPNGQFHPVKQEGHPRWLRPVSAMEHGEVPAEAVSFIKMCDIVEVQPVKFCPRGFQSENFLFKKGSLKVVRAAEMSVRHLMQLVEHQPFGLFGNPRKQMTEMEMAKVSRSLLFLKAESPEAFFTTPYGTKPRLRFCHNHVEYNLPVTDIDFIDKMQDNPNLLVPASDVFLTISISIGFEGTYYKLVAGVVFF